ncbi:MAG TPA: ATP-binding cassette domain-containing protein [Thermoleophilaceae bacterium]|nr:ATP-binding cassette domain-containing protein [Thermoleophilaceae bacterium]
MSTAARTEGLVRRFGETEALRGVDLEVAEGSVVGLLGPNGAGKTTLVRVLATLLRPDEGHAEVFGRDVVTEAGAVRELIGLTGQFAAVDELLSGRENLRMFGRLFRLSRRESAQRASELLERFGLADAGDRQVKTYSGGMRRRLDLASSLIVQPRVLFLDEPTTGLDPRSRNGIWAIARELVGEGVTILLTTQYLDEAEHLADRIAVIDHGRVIAEGTGDELKDSVGGSMVEVRLEQPAERERAREVLLTLGCEEPKTADRPDELTLAAPRDGVGMIAAAARALEEAELSVRDLSLRRPTLDDVFLELTGAAAAVDGEGSTDSEPAVEPEAGARR